MQARICRLLAALLAAIYLVAGAAAPAQALSNTSTVVSYDPGEGSSTLGTAALTREPAPAAWAAPEGKVSITAGSEGSLTYGWASHVYDRSLHVAVDSSRDVTTRRGPPVDGSSGWLRPSSSTPWVGVAAKVAACFVAGTPVLLADGTSKPIEDIEVGDKVMATDPATGEEEARTVARTFVHHGIPTWDVVVDGETVTTTAEHPFWVDGQGWTPVDQLRPGDRLTQPDGTTVAVDRVQATGQTADVYNFEVEGLHDYYVQAGDYWLLVHNTCLLGQAETVAERYGATAVEGGYSFASRRAARQAASELAGDLGSAPSVIRRSDFRGGPWSWKNSNGRIGVQNSGGSAGWRDDVLGHNFGDSVMGPHVNVWRGGQELYLFYPGAG